MIKMKNQSSKNHRPRGFTLLEMVMSIVLIGIIASVTVPIIFRVADSWLLAARRNELSESSQIAIDRMVREMRQVKNSAGITSAGSSVFQFTDINNNNIRYNLSGGQLIRTENGNFYQLSDNVSALAFNYYLKNGTWTSTPAMSDYANIKMIAVTLTLALAGNALSMEAGVSPRALQ
jgi:prepilin-type N-terminal cleavage/methylation domain-containing protein